MLNINKLCHHKTFFVVDYLKYAVSILLHYVDFLGKEQKDIHNITIKRFT